MNEGCMYNACMAEIIQVRNVPKRVHAELTRQAKRAGMSLNAYLLGEFEQIVLLAVLRLGEDAYGVPIRLEIEKRTGRSLTVGALYRTLDRLEGKGYVTSWFSDPTPERGGRSKRHYRLESSGERALRDATVAAKRICDDLERIWGEDVWTAGQRWKPARQS